MKLLFRSIERAAAFAAGCALAAASLVMLAQIAARFFLSAPFIWAEEFAVLLFAWITFLGAAAVQADDSHLSIDVLSARTGPRCKRVFAGLRRAAIVAIAAVLIYQGIVLSRTMWLLEFPAMGISRAWLYISVPVGFGLSLLLALRPPHWWPATTAETPSST